MLALLATVPSAFSGLATAAPRANVAMVFGAKRAAYKPVAKKSNFQKPSSRPAVNQWDRKPVKKGQTVNLKVPAPKNFAYGLPGSYNIIGGSALEFDPYGFLNGKTELEVNRYRECELTHGRVGMLAAVGFIVQESAQSQSIRSSSSP